jgi:hypothetical protein
VLVDDLNTLLSDAEAVTQRDEVVAWMDSHPNMELSLFNPWRSRDLASRLGESLVELPARARLVGYGPYSKDIEIFCYLRCILSTVHSGKSLHAQAVSIDAATVSP